MGNEVFFSRGDVLEKARRLVKKLAAACHEWDGTRPAASGGAQRGEFDLLGDLAGYNGDGAVLYQNPGFPNMVSEYGSYISDRSGEYAPHFTDGVEEDPSWRSGKALWCGFHHGSIADRMGHMGFIDYYRLPLRSWYWYRSELKGITPPEELPDGLPSELRLWADHTEIRTDGTDDAQLFVQVLDDSGNPIRQSLTVLLKIEEGGAVFPTGRTIELSPEKGSLLEGLGSIEVRGLYAGKIRVTASAPGLHPGELILTAVGGEAWCGQKISFQSGPPNVLVPSFSDEAIDLARSRPVFCSSFCEGAEPSRINDGNPNTFWKAASQAPGEWIRQDLEGMKSIQKVGIRFLCEEKTKVLLCLEKEAGKQERCVAIQIDPSHPQAQIEVYEDYRYVQVQFPEKPMNILELQVWGAQNGSIIDEKESELYGEKSK